MIAGHVKDAGAAGTPKAARKRVSGMKRADEWKAEEVQEELRKYTRPETAGTEAVCDPLVGLLIDERQAVLVKLLAEAGTMMERYHARRKVALDELKGFYEQPAVAALQEPRGRVIRLPVDVIPDDDDEDGATNASPTVRTLIPGAVVKSRSAPATPVGGPQPGSDPKGADDGDSDDDDDDSSSSSSSSSDPFEPSDDAPRVPLLDNAALLQQLETLMVESKSFGIVCAKVQEYLTLSVGTFDTEDTEVMEILAKLTEEFGAAREVASDRYDFYETYLDVRGGVERNLRMYPDVQAYRELLVARDASAWEEVARSWQLLASSLATLAIVVAQNIKYVVAPDVAVHHVTESSLFM
eukprot:CAMPEP_0174832724 /NCGR_PEP_ID=MMETSP1114-20130205/3823_1 /TAXON_ID=312471 /ORGANISM="Neobodo designis, Strain CCAP 1951/1" /LENGTH=353 /DNA_ID=CAMNT_0016066589 /DNA_START=38 /DNA_END=1099 /DNA_ORIENTATION=+